MGKKDKQNAAESTPEKNTAQQPAADEAAKTAETAKADKAAEKSAEPETFTVTREQMEKMEGLAKSLADEQDKYLRLAAEYDNYRKRTAKEKESLYADAKIDTIKALLGVYDNLERGLAHGPGRVLELLAVGDNLGWALEVPLVVPLVELVERVADEAAGAAAAVVERADVAVVGVEERVLVREQERRGEPRHVLRRHEVLGVLRDLLAVSLDEVLVDVGHHAVGDRLGPEVEAREACAHLVEHALLVELLAGLAHLEALQDLARVGGEPVNIGHERVARLGRA